MKSLVYGGATAALLMGLSLQAHAQVAVREVPVHAVPVEDDDAPAAPAKVEPAAPAADAAQITASRAEPAPVSALVQPKAPPAPVLTPEENAFFNALGTRVTDAASAYESFVRHAGAIDPAFHGAASVQRAVKVGAAYQPHQLEEGIVAYAALIALRNPEFVAGVRAVQNPAFADGLAAHPERVMQVRGAAAAAADVSGVLRAQGQALVSAGQAVTKAAYDIQTQPWSKSPVSDPKGVLDGAKTSAEEMRVATVPSKAKLLDSLVAAPQTSDAASAPAADVVRGLALAALAIQGRTGDGMEAQYAVLLGDPASAECLKLAKLNLNQCLAVAGPHYEDAYCTGRHAVSDTGKCITAAAGGPALDAAAPPKLQEAEAIGPEQAAAYGKPAPKDDDEDDDDDDVAAPAPAPALAAAPPVTAPTPATAAAPAPAPALAAAPPVAAPAPAPAPPQYAQTAPRQPSPAPTYAQSQPQYGQPQLQAPPQAQPQPYPQAYARNDYAPPPTYQAPSYPQPSYPQQAYPQQSYQQPYPQPQYQQPYPQSYPQPQYAPQPYPQSYAQGYAPQPYQQPRSSYAPNYGGQSYYPPQPQTYYPGGYYR
jgi:hypothetical protein